MDLHSESATPVSILLLPTLTLAHSLTLCVLSSTLFFCLFVFNFLFCIESKSVSHSVVSDSLQPHTL